MRLLLTALVIATCASTAFAEARLSHNGLRVAFSDTRFEVFTKGQWSKASLFCAAGDVARMRGAAANDFLVVTRTVQTSQTLPNRRSALFELVDRSTLDRKFKFDILSGFKVGSRMSVGAAVFACNQENWLR